MINHCIKFIILYSLLNAQLIHTESSEPTDVEKSSDLIINRVNLSDDKKAKLFTIAHLNDTHENLSVKWLGKGSSVMIILAKTNKAKNNASKTTNMYISYDYGENFVLEERLKLKDGSPAILNTFITSKVNNSHFVFTDIINNYLFISDDYGKTYDSVGLEFAPKNLQMHSTLPGHIIASNDSDSADLYFSQDFGHTWKMIRSNVSKFNWAPFEKKDRIYVVLNLGDGKKGLEYSDDYFLNRNFMRNNVKDFKICGNYVILTQYNNNIGGSNSNQFVTMSVAFNNGSLNFARYTDRTLLDVSDFIVTDCTDSELLVVGKSRNSSNYDLHISNQKGNRLRIVLSNIVVTQANGKTTVDLHRVAGLNNIYIANAYDGKSNTTIASLITNDSGYSWKKINLTQIQSDELTKSKCTSDVCSLHFLQNNYLQSSAIKYPGIISKESSAGIILANGVIDEHIKNDTKVKQVPETYVSRDAGEHWRRIADGKYLFNIGDNGGLIVGLKHFSKSVPTKTLIYSLDDGYTFNEIQFINESMRVYSLLTENGEKTTVFTIFGSIDNKPHSWTLVKVNLTSLYHKKCDKDSDFEFWRPHSNSNTPCVMGLQTKLWRRKSNASCLHGEDFERKIKPQLCDCTRDDYICDFGFTENENRTCVPVDLEEFLPECDPKDSTRTIIGGYLRIPGNQCLPTKNSIYENNLHISCQTKARRQVFKTLFISFLLTALVFASGYFAFMRFKNRQTRSTLLNTHYNRRTDSAILLDDDGLGEEAHVRHGFSDEVPMVIS